MLDDTDFFISEVIVKNLWLRDLAIDNGERGVSVSYNNLMWVSFLRPVGLFICCFDFFFFLMMAVKFAFDLFGLSFNSLIMKWGFLFILR